MHGTAPQLCEVEAIAMAVQVMPPGADILICPPSTLISRAAQVGSLIKRVRDSSIDAVLDENKKRPRLPDAIYEIAAKLEVAVSQGDIRRQAELCQSALGLAAAEGDLPSWALLFKAHLEALPEF